MSLPSAQEVLRTKVGDCNEHTVLFVAMARSLGIPARIDVGVAFVRGAFYYHAWPEVYIDEGQGHGMWLPVDPTFNQFPADATHLRLARGGLDKQTAILPLIGRVKAAGLTPTAFAGDLRTRLEKDYLVNPQVSVSVQEFRSQRVFVLGEVEKPGTYAMTGQTTLLDVLSQAGGPGKTAGRQVVVVRFPTSEGPVTPGVAGSVTLRGLGGGAGRFSATGLGLAAGAAGFGAGAAGAAGAWWAGAVDAFWTLGSPDVSSAAGGAGAVAHPASAISAIKVEIRVVLFIEKPPRNSVET